MKIKIPRPLIFIALLMVGQIGIPALPPLAAQEAFADEMTMQGSEDSPEPDNAPGPDNPADATKTENQKKPTKPYNPYEGLEADYPDQGTSDNTEESENPYEGLEVEYPDQDNPDDAPEPENPAGAATKSGKPCGCSLANPGSYTDSAIAFG